MSNRIPVDALTIALTGGIASGKSAVASEFERLGVAVVDADDVAAQVVEPGKPALGRLVETFGDAILHKDASLNRAALRKVIFDDPSSRKTVEGILHPVIQQESTRQLQQCALTSPYVMYGIPLLVETRQTDRFDRILVVDVSTETQIRRLMARDGGTREDALKILASQIKREDRLAVADDVIENEGTLDELTTAVEKLHPYYLKLAENQNPV